MTRVFSSLAEARAKLAADGTRFVQIEVPELDGGMRGKLVSIGKGLGGSIGFSNVMYGLTTADEVFETPFSSFENGFKDFFAHPQAETIRRLPWRTDTVAVICDMHDDETNLTPECPRTALRRAVDAAEEMGFEPRFAVEYEAFVFHADDEKIAAGAHATLAPLSRGINAYSLVRMPELRGLFEEFMTRMESIGAPLDSMHTELGPGAVEFALSHAPALEAADRAARAKLYFKELCAEHGLVATFMAKVDLGMPGAGAHVHQSLWRDGESVFWSDGKVSDIARHYAAGQLAMLPEITVLSMANHNSFRRMEWQTWVPENASWGEDNRSAALRLITHPAPKGVRFENRLPGADANPYLTIAGMLASGLHGIRTKLEPPPLCQGNAAMDERYARLPHDLEEATALFRASSFAREWFGDRFVDHFARSRDAEIKLWQDWLKSRVTEWEVRRFFETI